MEELTLEKFEEASEFVKDMTTGTKLVYSEYFSARTGNKIFFKLENIRYMGAYKVGGAYHRVRTLTGKEKSKSLITASTGNHVRGVTYVAKLAGVKAIVVVLTTVPLMKVSRTKSYGADVVLKGDASDEAYNRAYKLADEFGYTFVHPFDDLDTVTGQDTIAMEIIKGLPAADYILVSVGGGGLCTGVPTLTEPSDPKIRVIGVGPADTGCMQASLREGRVVGLSQVNTIADGATVKRSGEKPFPYIRENVDGIITIEDNEPIVAFLDMIENHKIIVKNFGLLTVAALKYLNVRKKKVVSILNGDNMDIITMSSIVQHGLIERDRVSTASVLLPDKSGELTRVSAPLAKEQGNIIKLECNQFTSISRNTAVELRITTEAFRTDHKNQIVSTLTSAGYRPKPVKLKGIYSEM